MTSSDLHPPGVQFEHEGGVAAVDDGLVLPCPRAGVRQVQELAPVELEGLGAWQEVGEVRRGQVVLGRVTCGGWLCVEQRPQHEEAGAGGRHHHRPGHGQSLEAAGGHVWRSH